MQRVNPRHRRGRAHHRTDARGRTGPDAAHRLGLGGDVGLTAEEVYEAVLDRGTAFALANGWWFARRRGMGADRIEVEGPADTDLPALKRLGCTTEIVSWRTRVFVPRAAVLERLLERWPLGEAAHAA